MEKITSARNPRIAYVNKLLTRPGERKREGLTVIEGKRELLRALSAGVKLRSLFFTENMLDDAEVVSLLIPAAGEENCFITGAEAFSRIAYREGTSGVAATAECPALSLKNLRQSACPLVLVLESVEKPGNLGAVMRTADAAGIDAVIVCNPSTDLYNPNTIRSSVGCVFTVPLVGCTGAEAIQWLREKGIKIFAAALQTDTLYHEQDFRTPAAFVFGAEDTGLSDQWRAAADGIIRIPMNGIADSLNVSVSAAVMIFEAVRQRYTGAQK